MLKIIVAAAAILLPGAALADDWGNFYAEVYGGAAFGTESGYNDLHYDTESTWAIGGAVGIATPVPGVSIGVDVMKTGDADYSTSTCCSITSYSVMAEGEYALPLNDTFAVYGALGIGAINVTFTEGADTNDAWGVGYSAAAGVRANVAENVAVFAEVKHQDTFEPLSIDDNDISAPSNTGSVGFRFGF